MGQRGFTPTMLLLLQLFPDWLPITGIQWNGGVGLMWRYPVPDGMWPTLTDRVWIKRIWRSRSSYSCWFYVFRTNEMDSLSDQVKVKRVSTMKAGRVRKKCMLHRSSECRAHQRGGWFSQQPLCSIYRTGNRSRLGRIPPWKDKRSWCRAGWQQWHQKMTTVG